MNVTSKMNQEKLLLISKIIIFLYIIISPFINHKKYLSIFELLPVKIIVLIIIILTALIDFQLAILLTIALFVIIINLNKNQLFQLFKENTVDNSRNIGIIPEIPKVYNSIPINQNPNKYVKENIIMPYNFPDDRCNTKPFEDIGISNELFSHYIDSKVKPYEVYIKMQTNSENLKKVQTNVI
jgi:hypothetical protein